MRFSPNSKLKSNGQVQWNTLARSRNGRRWLKGRLGVVRSSIVNRVGIAPKQVQGSLSYRSKGRLGGVRESFRRGSAFLRQPAKVTGGSLVRQLDEQQT